MAVPAAVLSILVQADGIAKTQSQVRGLHGDLGKADDQAGKTSSTLKTMAKGAGIAAGIGAITGAVGAAVSEFGEARKVAAQTRAVIKSTGGVANVSAKDIDALTGAISRKTGIDDEAIAKGSNLLLTFKNVRNEVGAGRDIFDQATQAAVDLSAAGFGSLESTSKQVGKALNDPVKGLAALGRSGVTFSEDQNKAIKALMKTGKAADRVKAQQMILKEVQSQVGGSAAAQATPMDHLRVRLGNLAEKAGAVLVPALDKVVVGLNAVMDAIGATAKWLREHETLVEAVGGAVGVFAAAYIASLLPALAASTTAIYAQVAAWVALRVAWLASPVGMIVTALAALVAGLIVAYKKSETFRDIVNAAFDAVKTVAGGVFDWLKGAVVAVVDFLKDRWENIKTAVRTYWELYKTLIINPVRAAFDWIRTAVRDVAGWLADRWENIKTALGAAWDGYKTLIINPIRDAIGVVKDVLGRGKDGLVGWLDGLWEAMKKAVDKLAEPFKAAFNGMKDAVRPVVDLVKDLVGAVKDAVEWIGKIKIPKIDLPDLNPAHAFGGKGGGNVGPGGAGLFNSVQSIADYSLQWGLSGGRGPNQAFRPGDDGWHGQNRARDLSGPAATMMAFAQMLARTVGPRLLELIFTPLGFGIKNGQRVPLSFWTPQVNADHFDHVHVAMARGGMVRQGGWALVGEQGPELARLPSGTRVFPADQSAGMLAAGGPGGGAPVHIHFESIVPATPQQARELGEQAARGFSFQGGGSSRSRVDLTGGRRNA